MLKNNVIKNTLHTAAFGVVVFCICLMVFLCGDYHQKYEPATPDTPDISLSGDLGYVQATADEVTIQAITGFVFQAHSLQQSVDIQNPKKNKYGFVVCLYLEDGTLLYKSTIIDPGERIASIELSKSLEGGIYRNSAIVYRFYSIGDNRPISQCEFPVNIKSIN